MAEKGGNNKYSALYNDHEDNVKVEIAGVNAIDVDITLIDRNPAQPRKTFNEDSLREMSSSVATYGVLQPLLVTESNGRYLIIAGERRFRAAYMAGLKKVPVIVRELTNQQIQEISLIENLHREDLNAIEAAEGMRELMENHGLTQEAVASRIGKSRPYVTNTLRLLQLPKEVTDLVKEGRLSPGHARALISIDDKDYLILLAKQACDNRLTVRELETKVRLYFSRKNIPVGPRKTALPVELKALVGDMKRVFATKVRIAGNESKGRIYIDYFNKDDLDRIHDLIERLKYDEKL
ncbi:MAG: ParB/RepB/Spo0J family partition protein [Clostridia bacterium]|nr:ParB/RepB/Spo0J family partition protein [Clostridia bacterium]MBR2056149.1 ParB/RepB/Spo0J family partition protein [Clostridia bacterium]MBR2919602.1 ParB/RepB/Spo0J family partition protein [Clostridia bacterium]